jgi:L-2-hydroxyglutarate oxidase
MQQTDVAVIGGGIVGLAVAYQIVQQHPGRSVTVLEKENQLAQHQTGHNSGVLHSGIYYKPGSLKAENCREGKKAMERFCAEHGIDYEICGKVIVAVDEDEVPRLQRIFERGQQNRVTCQLIGPERLHELEPHAAGVQAIWVPEAGIVNYGQVCRKLAEIVQSHGGRVETGARVNAIHHEDGAVVLVTPQGDFRAKNAVNCAGHAPRRSEASSQDRSLPRRILQTAARGAPSLPHVDLSDAGPQLPLPGRPLHADD